jgi:hypothetical protein
MRRPSFVAFLGGAALVGLIGSVGTTYASCASNPTCNPYDPTTGACCNAATCEWLSNGSACEDRNDCTAGTTCNSSHVCGNGVFSGATTCRHRGVGGIPLDCRSGTCNGTMTCTLGTDPCDDGNPCTDDCQDSTAITCHSSPHPEKAEGAACDADDNPCTVDECEGSPRQCVKDHDVVCPSSNPPECRMDQCQPATGGCIRVDKPSGTPCSPDNNACSLDVCSNGNCTHPSNTGAPCNDGNPCTTGERCNHNKDCGGGGSDEQGPYAPTVVEPGTACTNDNNSCTFDYCAGTTIQDATCEHTYINVFTQENTQGNSCNDGRICSANTTCNQGACLGAGAYCDTAVTCPTCQTACSASAGLPSCGCTQ